jgi:hypothetical protein
MSTTNTNSEIATYKKLWVDLSDLYSNFSNLKSKVKQIQNDYLYLKNTVELWNLKHNFTEFETEINQIIGNNTDIHKPKEVLTDLSTHWATITNIDADITYLEKEQDILLSLPDRFGRKELTDKIAFFFSKISSLHISELDKVKTVVIPNLKSAIHRIKDNFAQEETKVKTIKQRALNLQNRLDAHTHHVDRYNLKDICKRGTTIVSQIIKDPNYANLNLDEDKIAKIEKELYNCEDSFLNEKESYKDLKVLLETKDFLFWQKNYNTLYQTIDKALDDIYTFPDTFDKVQAKYYNQKDIKEKAIDRALQKYDSKILNAFEKEIYTLRNNCVQESELSELEASIENYIIEQKKKRNLQIAKIIGYIVAGFLALYGLRLVWIFVIQPYWGWILFGIIAIIVIFFISIIRE